MSVDSGEPRQRTVAELLAANGGGQPGRRRRRRADPDDDGAVGSPPAAPVGAPPGRPAPPRRPVEHPSFPPARRPEPTEAPFVPNGNAPRGGPPNGYPPRAGNGYAPPNGHPGPYGPPNGAAPRGPAPAPPAPPAPAPPAPQGWHRPADGPYGDPERPDEIPTGRFGTRATPAEDPEDGGPPTILGAPPLDDGDDVPTGRTVARPPAVDAGPPTGAYDPFADEADEADEAGAAGARTGLLAPERPEDDDDPPPAGLDEDAPAGAAGTGQAWAVVIAQWIGGAVAGAAIWVGFRYLWSLFPVVALGLAVLITVGLVLGVRALLRNDDLKTTLFAVLVGLLLTVSPALLVVLER